MMFSKNERRSSIKKTHKAGGYENKDKYIYIYMRKTNGSVISCIKLIAVLR